MKTVLVPTDFKVNSLDCVAAIANQFGGEELSFVFMHMFKLSDSITDLLMLSRRSREFELVDSDFYNRCIEIKRKYPQIKDIKVKFLYGSTLSMFRNFIEDNQVNYILNVEDCSVGKINKHSINPSTVIQRSGLPVISVEHQVEINIEKVAEKAPELELVEA